MIKISQNKVEKNGYTIVGALVSALLLGISAPMIYTVAVVPSTTQAKASNFQKADLKANLYALQSSKQGQLIEPVPDGCTVQTEDYQLNVHSIECIEGNISQVKSKSKTNIYLNKVITFSDDFTDNNSDGYEDTTGLPTHYDECYSGWKGNSGSSFKDASCELGGQYVIPMFSSLYSEYYSE